jgi:D-glycero-alpha-D-manno-heptose-7-phosphate kinase
VERAFYFQTDYWVGNVHVIITQTPYRVSFAGGGTDLPSFYQQEYGAVFSVAVQKHMYVTLSNRFEASTRVAYSRTEICDAMDDIQHTIVREALRLTGLGRHMEIVTIGDVPAGTGMGSSSALAVGLLHALHAYKGQLISRHRMAELACDIEINRLKKPIGRQDQYAAAFGGINLMRFNPNHTVDVEPVPCRAETIQELEKHMLLMYTNQQRDADHILQKQSDGTRDKMPVLRAMRDLSLEMAKSISGKGDLTEFARLLHEGWELKRSLGFGIADDRIDRWYTAARKAGAQAGKLLGAGGGGFLLLFAPPETHERIRDALDRPRELAFSIDRLGSRVIFVSE